MTQWLYKEIRWPLDSDEVRARLRIQGISTEDVNPQRFAAKMADEVPLWAEVIRGAVIRRG